MKLDPPRLAGGVHLNKALPYKVTSHRKNIDQPFKEANLWYDMVFFPLWITIDSNFLKTNFISIDQFFTVIIFKDIFDCFDGALGPRACLCSARQAVHTYDKTSNTLIAQPSVRVLRITCRKYEELLFFKQSVVHRRKGKLRCYCWNKGFRTEQRAFVIKWKLHFHDIDEEKVLERKEFPNNKICVTVLQKHTFSNIKNSSQNENWVAVVWAK